MTTGDLKLMVCRVCAIEVDSDRKCYNIFDKCEHISTSYSTMSDILIADKLIACANITVKKDDGMPNRICLSCLLDLEDAYSFKRKCEKSDDILRIALSNIVDPKCLEVSVKEENESDSENNIYYDDATYLHNDDLKPKCEISPTDVVISPDSRSEQQADPVKATFGVQAANKYSINTKSNNIDVQCDDCGLILKSKCKLRVHLKREHSKLPVTCTFCKLQMKSFRAFHNHQRNRPDSCICLSNFRIEGVGIFRHFYCKECQYSTKNARNAINHLLVHSKKCQYKCDQCDRSFVRIVTLRGHKERAHKHFYGQKICHICGKHFQGFTSYDSHMRLHRKNKAHCVICNKYFSSSSSLLSHKKTHSDLRAYKCEKCLAKFRTSAGLNCHMNVHMEKKPTCNVCGYTVRNIYTMRKHEKQHTPTNIACGICGKFFECNTQLGLHMKCHEKHHPCGHCNKAYHSRKNLTEHLRKVHQIYVSCTESNSNVMIIKSKLKQSRTRIGK